MHTHRILDTFQGVLFEWILTHQESWFHWESGIVQSEGECSLSWSSICLNFPGTEIRTSTFTLANAILLQEEPPNPQNRQTKNPKKQKLNVEAAKIRTLNTADTVWNEEPFFFPPFLLPPESPGDREMCQMQPQGNIGGLLKSPPSSLESFGGFFDVRDQDCCCCCLCASKLLRFGNTHLWHCGNGVEWDVGGI